MHCKKRNWARRLEYDHVCCYKAVHFQETLKKLQCELAHKACEIQQNIVDIWQKTFRLEIICTRKATHYSLLLVLVQDK